MAIFKYTVANKEGKKLSGTVEAPDESTARTELINLGFSILLLQETQEQPQIDTSLNRFIFEAIDKNSKLVSGTIPSQTEQEAINKLHSEYELNVSAIWPEGATQEQIEAARKKGQTELQNQLKTSQVQATSNNKPNEVAQIKDPEQEKKEQFIKIKIENILKSVNELLQNFEHELAPDQKAEINKKIDKLLRIKNSTNFDYILDSANELLKFLEEQEKNLTANIHQDKRFQYKLQTQKLLDELNQKSHQKTLSEDILGKIDNWQNKHTKDPQTVSPGAKMINSILLWIKNLFLTPPEILAIKEQIKVYNKQLLEFAKLYFKEPTPDYKEKVKNSIKTVWQARKRATENLKKIKSELKARKKSGKINEHLTISFIEELNALTGWLLFFYVGYYLVSLYLSTKNFGLNTIPAGLRVYDSHIFKYILVTIFLLHSSTSLKVNFFRNNSIANLVLPPAFVFTTIIALLNF